MIPLLVLEGRSLVKTVKFKDPKYIGDPINAVRIFNEMQVDELLIVDRTESRFDSGPNFEILRRIAAEATMPVSYAGGVSRVSQVENLVHMGIEKVGIGTQFLISPSFVSEASSAVGRQSIAVVLDYLWNDTPGLYGAGGNRGTVTEGLSIEELATLAQNSGAGEIILHNIQRDGTLSGYDVDTLETILPLVSIPIVVAGGASSYSEFPSVASKRVGIGVAAGSIFTLTGKFRSVLLQYPTLTERRALFGTDNETTDSGHKN